MDTVPGTESGVFTVETIRIYADMSIRRACGFALLGISCLMFAVSFDLALAFRTGAILIAIMAAVLYYKNLKARQQPYYKTELWILLPERPRAGKAELQRLIGGVLEERYWWHARTAGALSAGMAGLAVLVWLSRL